MNKDAEATDEQDYLYQTYQNGLNKMYEWLRVALFEAEVPSNLQEKITKRITVLRSEK